MSATNIIGILLTLTGMGLEATGVWMLNHGNQRFADKALNHGITCILLALLAVWGIQ